MVVCVCVKRTLHKDRRAGTCSFLPISYSRGVRFIYLFVWCVHVVAARVRSNTAGGRKESPDGQPRCCKSVQVDKNTEIKVCGVQVCCKC